jgi:hypothetical protein
MHSALHVGSHEALQPGARSRTPVPPLANREPERSRAPWAGGGLPHPEKEPAFSAGPIRAKPWPILANIGAGSPGHPFPNPRIMTLNRDVLVGIRLGYVLRDARCTGPKWN